MSDRIQITESFKQAVRNAVDIVDIAGDVTKLEKRGARHQGLCPFHQEKTPSFSVDPEQGLYYCFGCGAGGDAIGLYMETSGETFVEALETLAQRYGVPIPRTDEAERPESQIDAALLAAEEFFRAQLDQSKSALRYLSDRRISRELIDEYALGYAPDDWRQLTDALSKTFTMRVLEDAGLVARSEKSSRLYDRFRNRLIFPIHSSAGRLVGFGGRTLGEDRAKYINSAETKAFQKKHLLYNLHRARKGIRASGKVLLVEGYFDVIGSAACGIDWAVASMGTSLTLQQVRLMKRYSAEVILGYDGDRAGEAACRKALPLLLDHDMSVRRACFPTGQDPDSVRLDAGPEAVLELVEHAPDAIELLISRLSPKLKEQPRLQARAAERLRDLLEPVKDGVLRYAYVKQAAQRIGVPADVLWQGIENANRNRPPAAAEEQGAPPARPVSLVLSLEERVLQLLLVRDDETGHTLMPPLDDLPPPDVFFDENCRRLFELYLEVRKSNNRPDLRVTTAVREQLQAGPDGARTIDRLAHLLLQKNLRLNDNELTEALGELERRWQRKKSKILARAIQDAHQRGDAESLEKLIDEKSELSNRMHRRPSDKRSS